MKRGDVIFLTIIFLMLPVVASQTQDLTFLEETFEEDKTEVIIIYNEIPTQEQTKYNALNSQQGIEIEKQLPIINGVSAEVTKTGLLSLQNDPNVKSISYNYPIKASLQRSTRKINSTITNALQINSFNITGKDQTICILDTGINYTHNDFGGCSQTDFLNGDCNKVISGYDYVNNDANPYDDEGHGTHVAGIAAASNNITGVAPDAKIISIKVLDSGGIGNTANLISGIQWCVNNATKFNISVISMSLGTQPPFLFSSSCDSDSPATAMAVDNATLNNITVIASTGNDGSTTKISSPACLSNITSVGATDRTDNVASYGNRNSITDILAPGGEDSDKINSTSYSGLYTGESGTSMSVPHISGAIALINQYEKEKYNTALTTRALIDALRNNGKNITENGINYTRIDIIKTIKFLDNGPAVTLKSPTNGLNTSLNIIDFNCSATEDKNLQNITLYHDLNGTFSINQTTTLTGTSNQTNFTLTNIPDGSYNWNCAAYDNETLSDTGNINSTFRIDTVNPALSLGSPTNETSSSSATVTFTYNASDVAIDNCTLNIDGSADQTDSIVSAGIDQTFEKTFSNGDFTWSISCVDYANNQNTTETRDLTVSVSSGGSPGGGSGGSGGGGSSSSSVKEKETVEETPEISEVSYPSISGGPREENAKALVALNEPLKEVLEIIFGTTENLETIEQTTTSRKLEKSSTSSKLTTSIIYTGEEVEDFLVYDKVPKSFAISAKDIEVIAPGAEVTIVEDDPIFLFIYPKLTASTIEIDYIINKQTTTNLEEDFKNPIILVKQPENITIKEVITEVPKEIKIIDYWWLIPIAAFLIIMIFYFGQLIEYIKIKTKKR